MAAVENLAERRAAAVQEAANPWEGQVPLAVGNRTVLVRITMRRAGALLQEFGDDWGRAAEATFNGPDVEKLASLFSVLTGGDLGEEEFLDAWPPPAVVDLRRAYVAAHNLFWLGPPGVQMLDDDEEEAEAGKAKAPLATRTRWSKFGQTLLRQVWSRARSGNPPPGK